MANVFLTPKAYARLKAAKREGESFSDVIEREVAQEINWEKYVGCLKGMDVEKAKAELRTERNR